MGFRDFDVWNVGGLRTISRKIYKRIIKENRGWKYQIQLISFFVIKKFNFEIIKCWYRFMTEFEISFGRPFL